MHTEEYLGVSILMSVIYFEMHQKIKCTDICVCKDIDRYVIKLVKYEW